MSKLDVFFIILILIFLWLFLDFSLGRRNHVKKLERKIFPFRESNIGVFTTGPELFEDYFSELRKAKRHIHILFYIVQDDQFSKKFLNILKEKVQEGIEVRLLLDWVGAKRVKKVIKPYIDAGIQVAFAQKPKFPFIFYSLQVRNHRKITVLDGKIGYLGGFNVGKEYMDQDPKLSPWRDYHLKFTGQGVEDLQKRFLTDWQNASGQMIQKQAVYFPPLEKGKYRHQIVPSEGIFLEGTFSRLIREAEGCIMIGTPYFIPGKKVFQELKDALKRGVSLEILVPGTADHLLVKEASYPYLRKLIPLGARVYQYQKGFYHAKTLIIDDKVCDVGTANFDKRSFYLNLEINCLTYDKEFIEHVREIVKKDQNDGILLSTSKLRHHNPLGYCKELIARSISLFL